MRVWDAAGEVVVEVEERRRLEVCREMRGWCEGKEFEFWFEEVR